MIDLTVGKKMKVWCHTSYEMGNGDGFEKGEEYELTIERGINFVSCVIGNSDGSKIAPFSPYMCRFAFTKHGLYDPIRHPLYTDYFYDIYTHRNSEIDKILSEEDI